MKILLADDHHLLRDGLKLLIKRLDDDHDVEIAEADDFARALELAQSIDGLDLVILDLSMPGMDGLKGLDRMCETCPDVPVVILSGTYDRKLVLDALVRGAHGYIPKTLGGRSILSALQLVLSGEKFVPSIILDNNEQSRARRSPLPCRSNA
jgi:two-component system nitrate/nitrite response regulator NarL